MSNILGTIRRAPRSRRSTLSSCVAAAMLSSCGGSQSPIGAPGAMPQSITNSAIGSGFKVLHSFGYESDGAGPESTLIDVNGTLYGTTYRGGTGSECDGTGGCGTVFSVSTTGAETVLHSFGYGSDGSLPIAGLVDVNGTLYGTTEYGGAYGAGTVFGIRTTGAETVLHSFGYGSDGATVMAGLTNVKGTLYGTAPFGGAHGRGTVFSISTTGTFTVLHSFRGPPHDGSEPYANLIYVKGLLYGTTIRGGSVGDRDLGDGTVFSISRTGTERVLHNFGGAPSDGMTPYAGLVNINGTLFGTTGEGGSGGCGTVFSTSTTGTERVLHNFDDPDGSDGCVPLYGSLLDVRGRLYGTTWFGGRKCNQAPRTCGTVFSISTTGSEHLVHHFHNDHNNGHWPFGGLINVNGVLYGTTADGGAYDPRKCCGGGTVYTLTP